MSIGQHQRESSIAQEHCSRFDTCATDAGRPTYRYLVCRNGHHNQLRPSHRADVIESNRLVINWSIILRRVLHFPVRVTKTFWFDPTEMYFWLGRVVHFSALSMSMNTSAVRRLSTNSFLEIHLFREDSCVGTEQCFFLCAWHRWCNRYFKIVFFVWSEAPLALATSTTL